MATPYITEKGGKQYMYRATSHYSAEKRGPVAETEYMGVVIDGKLRPKRGYFYNEDTGEFGPIESVQKTSEGRKLRTKWFGDAYLLMALQKRLGILADLESSFGKDAGRMIMAVCFAYAIQPSALMHMEGIIAHRCIPELLDLSPDTDFSSQRMSDLTRHIGMSVSEVDDFFRCRLGRSEDEYIFDLTSESSYSVRNSFVEWGRNKDRMPLPMIGIGLVTDKKGRPLMFYVYPGSVADVTTLRRMVSDVKRLGGNGSRLVMDRGFENTGSIHYLLESGMDFVMPLKISCKVVKTMVSEMLPSVGMVEFTKVYDGRSYTVVKRSLGVRRNRGGNTDRVTVWEDPDGYELLSDTDSEFSSSDGFIDAFVFRDNAAAGFETSKMDVSLQRIMDALEGTHPRNPEKAVAAAAGDYASMLEWTMDEQGMHLKVRQNAHTHAANRKGVFIMIAPSSAQLTWDMILDAYGCRDIIEDTFLDDKCECDGRVPRSGDRDIVIGRTFLRMVSTILRVEIRNTIREVADNTKLKADLKPRDISSQTPSSLLSSLSNLEIIYGDGWQQLTEVTRNNRLIYKMFDVGPPNELKPY